MSTFGPNQVTKLNEIHQETYADKVENALPDGVKFLKDVTYASGKEGEIYEFRQPVWLNDESGFSTGEGAFEVNPPVPADAKKATIRGQNVLLSGALSALDALQSIKDERNYKENAGSITKRMSASMSKRLEILCLYGQSGIGTVESVKAADNNEIELTLTTEFSAGIFAGAEKLPLSIYGEDDAIRNIDGKPISITKVNVKDRKLQVKSNNTGNNDLKAIKAGDKLFFFGFKDYEMRGMQSILSNHGELFGIDAAQHSTWGGNIFDAKDKALSLPVILSSLEDPVNRGLEEEVTIMTNPLHWSQLNQQLTQIRVQDESYNPKNSEVGVENIKYHSINGLITLIPNIYMKLSHAFIYPSKRFKRLGSTDVTFGTPGTDIKNIWKTMEGRHGVYSRLWTCQAPFTAQPWKSCFVHGLSTKPVSDELTAEEVAMLKGMVEKIKVSEQGGDGE